MFRSVGFIRHRSVSSSAFALVLGSLAVACSPAAGARPSAATAAAHERAMCADVPAVDRDEGPFARGVVRVEPLHAVVSPKAPAPVSGVAVYVRPTPGMTEQWLGRVIECHVAHGAAIAASPRDPLLASGVRVAVSTTPSGFRVAIESDDRERARRILAAGEALVTN